MDFAGKNPASGRLQISQPMRIEARILVFGEKKEEKKFNLEQLVVFRAL